MVDRFKLITDVHVFLKNDKDKILMLRRENTGYEDGNYSVIAGHLDGHEEVIEAAIREAKEEAGIEIRFIDIKVVGIMHRKENDKEFPFFFLLQDGLEKSSTWSRKDVMTSHGFQYVICLSTQSPMYVERSNSGEMGCFLTATVGDRTSTVLFASLPDKANFRKEAQIG